MFTETDRPTDNQKKMDINRQSTATTLYNIVSLLPMDDDRRGTKNGCDDGGSGGYSSSYYRHFSDCFMNANQIRIFR